MELYNWRTVILSHISRLTIPSQTNMNHIDDLKDYLIADEIQRIKSLSRDELMQELISAKTLEIESNPVKLYENNRRNNY